MADPISARCRRTYFPAFHDSGYRELHDIRLIVLHDEEAPTAESAARYFQSSKSGGSAHLCVDDNECFRCLADTTIPWGAASAPEISANRRGFHVEMAGYARWSAVIWFSHARTLRRAAYKTALHCRLFAIPAVFVDAAALRQGKSGVTTHAEISKVSRALDPEHASRYSHSDPGIGFPRRIFMRLVRNYLTQLEAEP